ncbi:MAG TPA: carboxypeptidase-like regulatory domain-containing protein, partial [Candidatus Angelobacter sp.]|nr:carboxypeptidase-like regulatory domain-containing protein [Candidatus Angelobacter sp.]
EGEVFSKGAAKVPLVSGLTIFNARQQGKMLPLFEEGSMATAVLPGATEFSVALEAGLPLNIEAGRASFSLPAPAAGSVRLALVIPGDHTNVHISPGLITGKTSSNGQTTVEATLQPGQPASIWWQTREIAVPVVPKEVRFLSDVKTLVSVGEADLRIAALADVTVVQGEPSEFKLAVPAGYEITDVSGSTVEGSEISGNELTVRLSATAPRSHQFLISMEKQLAGATKVDVPFVGFSNTQRETGEVLVEGSGAMELTSKEGGGLKRMDLKEVSSYLRSLSHYPLQSAFRFHRQPSETPTLALDWVRFPDSSVLAAVAECAVVTTMVTSEGRSLTEVKLTVKNQAQPFLKVDLPQGASILSAEVAGEKVKPVQGTDGARVPLLRAGFRPTDAYEVSFVFLHSGAPFAKKGGSELALPSMDVPISVLEWEVYLPEQYKVKDFGGDAISASLLRGNKWLAENVGYLVGEKDALLNVPQSGLTLAAPGVLNATALLPGQIGGVITDPSGAVVPGAVVHVTTKSGTTQTVATDSNGRWMVSGMPSGTVSIQATARGFNTTTASLVHDQGRSTEQDLRLNVGAATETITVTAEPPMIETSTSQVSHTFNGAEFGRGAGSVVNVDKKKRDDQAQQASANVFNLQKKVAGVLPVRVDVPRAGSSYRFARTLVLDEETKLTFSYRTK